MLWPSDHGIFTDTHRAKFLMEAVADLKARLRDPSVKSDLLVAVGKPEDVIPGGCASWVTGSDTEVTLLHTHTLPGCHCCLGRFSLT